MKNQNEKKESRDKSRTNDTPLQRGSSFDNDLRSERRIAYSNGDRDAFDTIYGAPGEFPAMGF